jgi:SAM-dependent methyltransferase
MESITNHVSKLCDAADWFRRDVDEIIRVDLREPARFQRKQWEFAMIFLALRQLGMVRHDKVGLSLGGGTERLLYVLAQRIGHLTVTDLYEPDTSWDCARTDDPDRFVKSQRPFEVDDSKYRAMRMDMRSLRFPDQSFDFCYSSCAIEHIGASKDFRRHLNEVARVLRDGGVYVFTTEVSYLGETIKDPNNYVFSPDDLAELVDQSGLVPESDCDMSVSHHQANLPLPSNRADIAARDAGGLSRTLLESLPHVTLLRGRYPFTSGLFVLRKENNRQSARKLHFVGREESARFMQQAVEDYRDIVEQVSAVHNPFSALGGQKSRFYLDHADYFIGVGSNVPDAETIFHTDYIWLGNGSRVFTVELALAGEDTFPGCTIDVRVHRYATLDSSNVECVVQRIVSLDTTGVKVDLRIAPDADSCYAILAKRVRGICVFDRLRVTSEPMNMKSPTKRTIPRGAQSGKMGMERQVP